MDPGLSALLTHSVRHARYQGQDDYGMPRYGPESSLVARIEHGMRRIVDSTGVERISRTRLFLDGTVTLALKDRVTLPDGTTPPMLLLMDYADEQGQRHHWEASF